MNQWKQMRSQENRPDAPSGVPSRNPVNYFSLIEILIVISIIAILVSILLPALGLARVTAQRISCSNSLKQYALSIENYRNDNLGYYMWASDKLGDPNSTVGKWSSLLNKCGYTGYRIANMSNQELWIQQLKCPVWNPEPSYSYNIQSGDQSYNINAVRWPYGGGLGGKTWNLTGLKGTEVKRPSNLVALAERERLSALTPHNYFSSYKGFSIASIPSAAPDHGTGIRLDAHKDNSNYLFSDGHVSVITCKKVRFLLFQLEPEKASGYSNRSIFNRE